MQKFDFKVSLLRDTDGGTAIVEHGNYSTISGVFYIPDDTHVIFDGKSAHGIEKEAKRFAEFLDSLPFEGGVNYTLAVSVVATRKDKESHPS